MRSITKKLLFVLITIMAHLPMTVAYAVPDISVPQQTYSTDMNMNMDMADCHSEQVPKKCGHCSDQHNCNTAHGSCSVSVGITELPTELYAYRNATRWHSTFHASSPPAQSSSLFRPPITL
ncbi:MAG: hypothetical protein OEW63_01650 [Gammaproteobacteria bacterium]|nr:hypothetical protein [Gammaproteobacteria bacterium]